MRFGSKLRRREIATTGELGYAVRKIVQGTIVGLPKLLAFRAGHEALPSGAIAQDEIHYIGRLNSPKPNDSKEGIFPHCSCAPSFAQGLVWRQTGDSL